MRISVLIAKACGKKIRDTFGTPLVKIRGKIGDRTS